MDPRFSEIQGENCPIFYSPFILDCASFCMGTFIYSCCIHQVSVYKVVMFFMISLERYSISLSSLSQRPVVIFCLLVFFVYFFKPSCQLQMGEQYFFLYLLVATIPGFISVTLLFSLCQYTMYLSFIVLTVLLNSFNISMNLWGRVDYSITLFQV